MVWGAGAVGQAGLAEASVAVDPFAGALAGDAHLGGDVGDRAGLAALYETVPAFDGQRGVTVEHGRVFLAGRTSWWYFSSCR
jgi:hypothetical protein